MVQFLLGRNSMSWKPKTKNETIIFEDEPAKGLEITFRKSMSIRELNDIQKLGTDINAENMEALCTVLASKIVSWNYDGVKPTADALLDLSYEITTEITSKIIDAIVGTKSDKNLVEPSPNGLNLEGVSGVMAQQ